MILVAQIIGKALNGGVEACIWNYYKAIDKEKVQFHFFVENTSAIIDKEKIEKLGGKIIVTPKYTHIFKYIKFLIKTFKNNKYDIVHSNLNALSVFPLFAAKLAGIKVRIAHSHSTTNKKEFLRNLIKNFLKLFSKTFATDYFACSELAGRWLFGKKAFNSGKVFIVNNAIDLDKFKFDCEKRAEIRKLYGVKDDDILLGNIGRLCSQKNQAFLLKVLKALDLGKYKLMIIGDGELKKELLQTANDMCLENNLILINKTTEPQNFYSAFDVFLLPSLYEGLPIVGVEAQANGLECLFSTFITKEIKLLNSSEFLDINSPDEWAKKIMTLNHKHSETNNLSLFDKYNIKVQADALLSKYFSILKIK